MERQWHTITAEEASGTKVALPASHAALEVNNQSLKFPAEQDQAIRTSFTEGHIMDLKYAPLNEDQQIEAASELASHRLDLEAQESFDNRWSIKWSRATGRSLAWNGKRRLGGFHISDKWSRLCQPKPALTLLHSDCSYDDKKAGTKCRRNPVNFTGCLAHVEVMFAVQTAKILWICRHLTHNMGCQEALMSRIPAVCLHPSVYEVALQQLKSGISLTAIQY